MRLDVVNAQKHCKLMCAQQQINFGYIDGFRPDNVAKERCTAPHKHDPVLFTF